MTALQHQTQQASFSHQSIEALYIESLIANQTRVFVALHSGPFLRGTLLCRTEEGSLVINDQFGEHKIIYRSDIALISPGVPKRLGGFKGDRKPRHR